MNWTRGLFRLWLLLSVLWIAGITALAWSDPRLVAGYFRRPTADEINDCNAQKPGPWCEANIVWDPSLLERAYDLRWYGLAAFGVPAAVFLLGLAGGWVVTGFRRRG